ncbi:hypothetical protein OG948_51955 (plasmid) [Embleya sp. NBC_00888]|uniref:hypothetical protein n=1 Tax=Embleya sp. NBC_00888 TaxID=2975960 RepID=UPI002F90AC1F|nr:hypothetical protein OG948_51955 [Embleya sp. NBC_00888]
MAYIQRHRFKLIPWPWTTMAWVQVPEGLEYTLYEVGDVVPRVQRVRCLPEEYARWYRAFETFQGELRSAESDVRYQHGIRYVSRPFADRTVIRRHWVDLMPNRRERSRASFERCAARMRAADAVYAPIRLVIEERLAEARAAQAPTQAAEE